MTGIIQNIFIDKPIGFVIALISAICSCYSALPTSDEPYTYFIFTLLGSILILTVYGLYLYQHNKLPSAHKNELGVLFIIHALDNEIYKDVIYNFKESFMNSSFGICNNNIRPVFVNSNKIPQYNVGNISVVSDVLKKTNCIFCVDIVYIVDDTQNTFNYKMKIQTQAINSIFTDNLERLLKNECERVSKPYKDITFTKKEKITTLEVTAHNLKEISEYIIGLILLFSGNYNYASTILKELYENTEETNPINERAKTGYYYSLNDTFSALSVSNLFYYDKLELNKAEEILNTMNMLYPNTFHYHLNMANIVFLKYRNINLSLKHIDHCKKINTEDSWKYSKAFLTAYTSNNINEVLNAYRFAIKSQYSAQKIIEFIEIIVSQEPDKVMLYFVLSLLYNAIKDNRLTIEYLKLFYDSYKFKDEENRLKIHIEKILECSPCTLCTNDECNFSCEPILLI